MVLCQCNASIWLIQYIWNGSYILGYVIGVEIVEGCIGKSKTKTIIDGNVSCRDDQCTE